MDPIRIHLVLNHLPVIGSGLALLVLLAGLVRSNLTVIRTALAVAILALAAAPVVNWSGEEAEELIEDATWKDGATYPLVEEHEERGKVAVGAMVVSLAVCALALVLGLWRDGWQRGLGAVAALSLVAALGLGLWAAEVGGRIRHTEIRAEQG